MRIRRVDANAEILNFELRLQNVYGDEYHTQKIMTSNVEYRHANSLQLILIYHQSRIFLTLFPSQFTNTVGITSSNQNLYFETKKEN